MVDVFGECSVRLKRILRENNINTWEELSEYSEKEFAASKGCGRKTINEAKVFMLIDYNLSFSNKYVPSEAELKRKEDYKLKCATDKFSSPTIPMRESQMAAMVLCGESYKFVGEMFGISWVRVRQIYIRTRNKCLYSSRRTTTLVDKIRHTKGTGVAKDRVIADEFLRILFDFPEEK